MKSSLASLGVLVTLAGCSVGTERDTRDRDSGEMPARDSGPSGTDSGPRVRVDSGPIEECRDVVDVVFVLDVSGSMGFVLNQLEEQIGEVVTRTMALAPDPHFGIVAFADNERLDTTGALQGGLVHTEARTLQAAFRNFRMVYTDNNRNPGDGPSGPTFQNPICEENSLDALHTAATRFPWRANATRVIIHVTDDTFIQAPDNYGDKNGDGRTDDRSFPAEGNYPARQTLAGTVQVLRDARIRVFSFTRLRPPPAFDLFNPRCDTPRRRDWSQITYGWSQPYDGMRPIPEATDARNFDLDAVRTGTLSLAATINDVVVESYCDPPLI